MIEIVIVKGVRSVEDQMRAVLEYLHEKERQARARRMEVGELMHRLLMSGMTEDMRFSKPEPQEADECNCPICTLRKVIEAREAEQKPTTPQGAAMPSEAQTQEAVMQKKLGPNYPTKAGPWDSEGLKDKPIGDGSPEPGTDSVWDRLQYNVRHAVPGTKNRELATQGVELYTDGITTLQALDLQTDEILEYRSRLRAYFVNAGMAYK